MGLPDLYNPPPEDEGWQEYWFNHYNDHLEIVQAFQKLLIPMTVYIIYPWSEENKDTILEQHQQFHNDMNAAAGLPGSDISDFDQKNQNEMKAWVYLNYQEHLSIHTALNI